MRLHRRAFTSLIVGSGLLATGVRAQGKIVEVTMKQAPKMAFAPAVVNINVGDTVKWTNPGYVVHTVTFDPSAAQKATNVALPAGVAPFGSGSLEEEGAYSHTFTVKGTYKYICKFHEMMGMVGTVIVS